MKRESVDQLQVAEQEILFRLHQSKDATERARLEQSYNEAFARRQQIEGGGPPLYRRDVRTEFTVAPRRSYRNAKGNLVEEVEVSGVIHDPDTIINWRNTDVGGNIDRKNRSGLSAGTGDHAGHLVCLAFGIDPAEKGNLGRQNSVQNQGGGTYHKLESALRAWAKDDPHRPLMIRVRELYMPEKYGTERSFARVVEIRQAGSGQNGKEISQKFYFVNPTTRQVREAREQPRPPGGGILERQAEREQLLRAGRKPSGLERER